MPFIKQLSALTKQYPVIATIVILQLCMFLCSLCFYHTFFLRFSGDNQAIKDGQYWRLFTSIFLHGTFFHLFYNILALILFGRLIEHQLGKITFIILYVISGCIGNVLTFFLLPIYYVHVGSSGSIFGILGVNMVLWFLQKKELLQNQQYVFILVIVVTVMLTSMQKEINITAHIGGLLTGMLGGYFIGKFKRLSI